MRLSDERLAQIIDPGSGMSTDEEVALATEVRALRAVEKAAEYFVAKVDSGRARSVYSYDKFVAALAGVRALEWEHFVCPECGPRVKADEDGCCATCGRDCRVEGR